MNFYLFFSNYFYILLYEIILFDTGYLGLLVAMQRFRRKIGVPLAQAS